MFRDNIFHLFSAKISNLAIRYQPVVTTALLNFFMVLLSHWQHLVMISVTVISNTLTLPKCFCYLNLTTQDVHSELQTKKHYSLLCPSKRRTLLFFPPYFVHSIRRYMSASLTCRCHSFGRGLSRGRPSLVDQPAAWSCQRRGPVTPPQSAC